MLVDDLFESRGNFSIGDPVIITGDVEFRGKTGDVRELGRDSSFVVVDLYNYGPYSFHASDVEYNDYADSQDDQDVTEVSKSTLDQYVAKASDAHGDADFKARMSKHDPDKRSYHVDQKKTAEKRRQGISRALDRMSRQDDVAEGNSDWSGSQGRFAGDVPVNLGGAVSKRLDVGDVVSYFGEKATIQAMSKDRTVSRIDLKSGITQNVKTSDLKRVGQGVAEDSLEEIDRRGFLKGAGAAAVAGAAGYEIGKKEKTSNLQLPSNPQAYFLLGYVYNIAVKFMPETNAEMYKWANEMSKLHSQAKVEVASSNNNTLEIAYHKGTMAAKDTIDEIKGWNNYPIDPTGQAAGLTQKEAWEYARKFMYDKDVARHAEYKTRPYYDKLMTMVKQNESVNQGVAEGDKIGNMDADRFDDAMARLKRLAGAGPLKTVWDPQKRVYRNVPTAVQPQAQPKK